MSLTSQIPASEADLSTRCPQKTSTPFLFTISLEFSHSSLTPFRLFLQMFLLHFLLAQKLLEGFCRDSSDCSIRALPISWPLNNSLLSFVEHVSLILLIIEDGTCNVRFRLVKRALLFPSCLLHYHHHDFCSHPHIDLSFTKKL